MDKRSLRKQKTRISIKEAALQIADEQGWSAVTIRKIADKVLYAPPVVYEHFKDKDDLFRELVHDGFRQLTNDTLAAIDKIEGSEAKLKKIFEIRFDFADKHKTLHAMMFSTNGTSWKRKEIHQAMSEFKEVVFNIIGDLASDKSKVHDHFIQFICITIGFTYMNNNILQKSSGKVFNMNTNRLKKIYLEAIENIINGMKNQH